VQVDPLKPKLKPPGAKRLNLKCDILLSTFAFKVNLRRYSTGIVSCVGKETIPFKTKMQLAGKVEEYMNLIIDKMRSELKIHLFDSIKAGAYTRSHFSST
jgi:hypothetical protein